MLAAFSEQRPEVWLNTLQGTKQSFPNVNSAKVVWFCFDALLFFA